MVKGRIYRCRSLVPKGLGHAAFADLSRSVVLWRLFYTDKYPFGRGE